MQQTLPVPSESAQSGKWICPECGDSFRCVLAFTGPAVVVLYPLILFLTWSRWGSY